MGFVESQCPQPDLTLPQPRDSSSWGAKKLMRVLGSYDVNIATRNALALRRQLHRFLYVFFLICLYLHCENFMLFHFMAKQCKTPWDMVTWSTHDQPFMIPRFYINIYWPIEIPQGSPAQLCPSAPVLRLRVCVKAEPLPWHSPGSCGRHLGLTMKN